MLCGADFSLLLLDARGRWTRHGRRNTSRSPCPHPIFSAFCRCSSGFIRYRLSDLGLGFFRERHTLGFLHPEPRSARLTPYAKSQTVNPETSLIEHHNPRRKGDGLPTLNMTSASAKANPKQSSPDPVPVLWGCMPGLPEGA